MPNQTVQRTGASGFAQRQIERQGRLAPVADLCVRHTMTDSDIFDEFERLWGSYRVCSDAAAQLATPNFEDDEFMRMAIVAFSYHQKTEEWHRQHWKFAQEYLAECDHFKDTSK